MKRGPGHRGTGARLIGALVVSVPLCLGAPVSALAQVRADTVNRLMVPQMVQERAPTSERSDEAIIQALEHKIRCTCGCGLDVFVCRTTDFTCQTSPAMHRVVLARLDSGMTAEQVIASFEAQYGQVILMQPPKKGFNWAAYVMPFVALFAGLGLLAWLMKRWKARPVPTTTPETETVVPQSDEQLQRLQRELENFEA